MRRAPQSFDVELGNHRLGCVEEGEDGSWIAYRTNGDKIGSYPTPTAAREAMVSRFQRAQQGRQRQGHAPDAALPVQDDRARPGPNLRAQR